MSNRMLRRAIGSIVRALLGGLACLYLCPGAITVGFPAPVSPSPSTLSIHHPPVSEWPMWGGTPSRNMVSREAGAPRKWDIKTGLNIKWWAALGSRSRGEPVVADGVVYVGTNNEGQRDRRRTEDAGVLMAFDADTGRFLCSG